MNVCNCKDRNRDKIVFKSGEERGEGVNLAKPQDISYLKMRCWRRSWVFRTYSDYTVGVWTLFVYILLFTLFIFKILNMLLGITNVLTAIVLPSQYIYYTNITNKIKIPPVLPSAEHISVSLGDSLRDLSILVHFSLPQK